MTSKIPASLHLSSILRGLCPKCQKGSVRLGVLGIRPRCLVCDYNFHPEPGFYLGAMAVGFLLAAAVTIPPTVILKLLHVDILYLIAFPFVEFIFVGTFIIYYCRILWLHLEFRMTEKLDGDPDRR